MTTPVVPRIEMPPRMPRRPLSVFSAIFSPSGTEISTSKSASSPAASATASAIILRGTGLIAGSPGGIGRPGRVTVPTPGPALKVTPAPAAPRLTVTLQQRAMRDVGIVAGILHHAGPRKAFAELPFGKREGGASCRRASRSRPGPGIRRVTSAAQAAFAAAAEQAPVVQPRRK